MVTHLEYHWGENIPVADSADKGIECAQTTNRAAIAQHGIPGWFGIKLKTHLMPTLAMGTLH